LSKTLFLENEWLWSCEKNRSDEAKLLEQQVLLYEQRIALYRQMLHLAGPGGVSDDQTSPLN
jgi:hypothetical protein